MRVLTKFRVSAFLFAALVGLALISGSSAQSVGAPGQQCQGTTDNSGAFAQTQASCAVFSPNWLTPDETVVAGPSVTAGIAQCLSFAGPGYTTSGTPTGLGAGLAGVAVGASGCAFEITSGAVPPGGQVGTVVMTLPASTSIGVVQLGAAICSDPTCDTALAP
jgi:hypothetical protein